MADLDREDSGCIHGSDPECCVVCAGSPPGTVLAVGEWAPTASEVEQADNSARVAIEKNRGVTLSPRLVLWLIDVAWRQPETAEQLRKRLKFQSFSQVIRGSEVAGGGVVAIASQTQTPLAPYYVQIDHEGHMISLSREGARLMCLAILGAM